MSMPHRLHTFRHLLMEAASRRPNDEFSNGDNVRRNLAAYTAPGSNYPQYVSINRDGDRVSITVREPAKQSNVDGAMVPKCGETVTATISLLEWRNLLLEIVSND